MERTKHQVESERAKKRAKTHNKEKASDDSESSSDSSDGSVSLIDSDGDKPTTKPPATVEVVSKDDLSRQSSSNNTSPRPKVSSPGARNKVGRQVMTIKVDPQTFIEMRGMDTYEEILAELNKTLEQYSLDDAPVFKKLLEHHHARIDRAGTGTYEASGNASARLSKSGNLTARYHNLLAFDEGKYKLIKKSLKTIADMAAAHDDYAGKVRAVVMKLSNSLHNLNDQLSAFKNDTAANAKTSGSAHLNTEADTEERNGVLTSVTDNAKCLGKVLNKQLHLQTALNVLLEHKPYEDELLDNIKLTKIYVADKIAQSENDVPLQAQINALKAEITARDAVISSQAESLVTLASSYEKVAAGMVIAAVQDSSAKAEATEENPPPRQLLSSSQLSQNRRDRLTIIAQHQDDEYAKFEDQEKTASSNFRKFRNLLKLTMEASMRMSWNRHALTKVWSILMPDYPFTDTAFKHLHIRPEGTVSKPYNAITDTKIEHGYGTASGDLPEKDRSPGRAMSAVVQQYRFLLENMKRTRDECTSLCVQKGKHDAPTVKQLQNVRWFSASTGLIPCPSEKYNDFFATAVPSDYENARHTQLRTQIRLFIGWDFENKKPMYLQTDAIWYLYFVEKLTKRIHNELSEDIHKKVETNIPGKKVLGFKLPIEFFFFDESQSAPTDPSDPRRLNIARKGYTALLKLMNNERGTIYSTIMSVGASFFKGTFNDANAKYPAQQFALNALLKPDDIKFHVDNNHPPAYLHKLMREKWSRIDIQPLKRSQTTYAEQKWTEYFVLNLNKLQAHSELAHNQYRAYSISTNSNSKYTPLQNSPLVQAAFNYWPSTTFEALVAEASALN
jgi:hypothetical protein